MSNTSNTQTKGNGIRIPVTKVRQGDHNLFVAELCPDVLLKHTQVDVWEHEMVQYDPKTQGYQRAAQRSHFSKVGQYLAKDKKALLPTSVLLSVRDRVVFEPLPDTNNTLGYLFIPEKSLPLYIVDGQHRIAGLRFAIEEQGVEWAKQFCLPAVIMAEISKTTEMKNFYVVNSTAKKIDTDLAERLLSEMDDDELLGKKRGWLTRAIEIADSLNNRDGSPWEGRLQRPNTAKVGEIVLGESSFTRSLVPILTIAPWADTKVETVTEVLNRYWMAIESLMTDAFESPKEFAIQKTTGAYTMHLIAPSIFEACRSVKYSQAKMRELLEPAVDNYLNAEFWAKGGDAGTYSSSTGFSKLASRIKGELQLDTVTLFDEPQI